MAVPGRLLDGYRFVSIRKSIDAVTLAMHAISFKPHYWRQSLFQCHAYICANPIINGTQQLTQHCTKTHQKLQKKCPDPTATHHGCTCTMLDRVRYQVTADSCIATEWNSCASLTTTASYLATVSYYIFGSFRIKIRFSLHYLTK